MSAPKNQQQQLYQAVSAIVNGVPGNFLVPVPINVSPPVGATVLTSNRNYPQPYQTGDKLPIPRSSTSTEQDQRKVSRKSSPPTKPPDPVAKTKEKLILPKKWPSPRGKITDNSITTSKSSERNSNLSLPLPPPSVKPDNQIPKTPIECSISSLLIPEICSPGAKHTLRQRKPLVAMLERISQFDHIDGAMFLDLVAARASDDIMKFNVGVNDSPALSKPREAAVLDVQNNCGYRKTTAVSASRHDPASKTQSRHDPASKTESRHDPASKTQSRHDPAPKTQSRQGPAPKTESRQGPASKTESRHDPAPKTQSRHDPASKTESLHDSATKMDSTAENQHSLKIQSVFSQKDAEAMWNDSGDSKSTGIIFPGKPSTGTTVESNQKTASEIKRNQTTVTILNSKKSHQTKSKNSRLSSIIDQLRNKVEAKDTIQDETGELPSNEALTSDTTVPTVTSQRITSDTAIAAAIESVKSNQCITSDTAIAPAIDSVKSSQFITSDTAIAPAIESVKSNQCITSDTAIAPAIDSVKSSQYITSDTAIAPAIESVKSSQCITSDTANAPAIDSVKSSQYLTSDTANAPAIDSVKSSQCITSDTAIAPVTDSPAEQVNIEPVAVDKMKEASKTDPVVNVSANTTVHTISDDKNTSAVQKGENISVVVTDFSDVQRLSATQTDNDISRSPTLDISAEKNVSAEQIQVEGKITSQLIPVDLSVKQKVSSPIAQSKSNPSISPAKSTLSKADREMINDKLKMWSNISKTKDKTSKFVAIKPKPVAAVRTWSDVLGKGMTAMSWTKLKKQIRQNPSTKTTKQSPPKITKKSKTPAVPLSMGMFGSVTKRKMTSLIGDIAKPVELDSTSGTRKRRSRDGSEDSGVGHEEYPSTRTDSGESEKIEKHVQDVEERDITDGSDNQQDAVPQIIIDHSGACLECPTISKNEAMAALGALRVSTDQRSYRGSDVMPILKRIEKSLSSDRDNVDKSPPKLSPEPLGSDDIINTKPKHTSSISKRNSFLVKNSSVLKLKTLVEQEKRNRLNNKRKGSVPDSDKDSMQSVKRPKVEEKEVKDNSDVDKQYHLHTDCNNSRRSSGIQLKTCFVKVNDISCYLKGQNAILLNQCLR
ncbi:uncharacterized protein LOC141910837 isoform X2 [Tubulanus polymorphus]